MGEGTGATVGVDLGTTWTAAAWAGISIAPLGLALLEVGRLPRLTYAGVIPFLAGLTVVLTTGTSSMTETISVTSPIAS